MPDRVIWVEYWYFIGVSSHSYIGHCYNTWGQKFYSPARNYEWNLQRASNFFQSTRPTGWVLWEELLVLSSFTLKSEGETSIFWVLNEKSFSQYMGWSYEFEWANEIFFQWYKELYNSYYVNVTPLCSLLYYAFKGQVHMFAGWVKFVSHSFCRTRAILKYFCPL